MGLIFHEFAARSPKGANIDMKPLASTLSNTIPCTRLHHLKLYWRSNMLALIARWTHNILLASMGLVTIALVIWGT